MVFKLELFLGMSVILHLSHSDEKLSVVDQVVVVLNTTRKYGATHVKFRTKVYLKSRYHL